VSFELDDLLASHTPVDEGEAEFPGGVRLRIRGYLTDQAPPLAYVSSVRAVVLRGDDVLVFRDKGGAPHLLPGGRREGDEPIETTLRREVREETGWEIAAPRRLGFIHFHHLTPRPPGYAHPYPDFVQLVYAAEAESHTPDAPIVDEWVVESALRPIAEFGQIGIARGELLFLEQALRQRGGASSPGAARDRPPC
jgi:ADP-ribose pyrophosphatase YjhB (NUDIX family)